MLISLAYQNLAVFLRETTVKRISFFLEIRVLCEVYIIWLMTEFDSSTILQTCNVYREKYFFEENGFW